MRPRWALAVALLCLAACRRGQSESAAADTAATPAAPAAPAGETAGAGAVSWLDRPLAPWASPGGAIPKPPAMSIDAATREHCKQQLRPPVSAEDKLVTEAGWILFGPLQTFGPGMLVSGMASVDGNCRPRFMQTFVFRGGAFAGTIAPEPMDARTDGAQRYAFLPGDDYVVAEFARYVPGDALCCPSKVTTVAYDVKTDEPGKPVLVPRQAMTMNAAKP